MTDAIITHDAGVSAFEDAGGVVQTTDDEDGAVQFSWDEQHVVQVDAPANLAGAFDTDRFYKIEGATIARPIKQPYMVGDELKWYKKPAEELDRAAWSFDNAPYTLGHPDTGMVKNVDDIHGFWRNPRYDHDEERFREDLYVPVNDDEAMEFIEENGDVSMGFYNRVHSDYTGNTGDLSNDEGLDGFQVDMFGNHIAGVERGRCSSEHGCGLDDQDHGEVVAAGPQDTHESMTDEPDSQDDVDSTDGGDDCGCSDEPNQENENMADADTDTDFDIPDLSVDAIVEKNEAVRELKEQADEADDLREELDEMRTEVTEAFDSAENFSVELEEDECPCEAVDELVSDLDAKAEEVENLEDELSEYREDDIEERLDRLEDLGAEREDWEEAADEADDPIEALDEEIKRREEVLDAAGTETSVKDVEDTSDTADEGDVETTMKGTRRFGRGHSA